MIKIMLLVSRRADISREAFRAHYESVHAPLAASHLPHLVRYVRNHVVDRFREDFDCDVITEFWFDHPGPWREARKVLLPDDMLALFAEDEAKFMDRESMRVIVVEQGETPAADLLGRR
jgi:hypothetical protein